MKVRYVGVSFGADSLTDGKIYDVVELDEFSGGLRVVDDSGEDYLYSPNIHGLLLYQTTPAGAGRSSRTMKTGL